MCGRYRLTDPGKLARTFPRLRFSLVGAALPDLRVPRFNIAPTQVVLGARDVDRDEIEALRWGIHGRINVRAESLVARRGPIGRRCVVFADGFYEWHDGTPIDFALASDEAFALAGVWEAAREGPPSCAIVTCEPNELIRPIHDRMPAIVPPDALELWLAPEALPPDVARAMLRPFAARAMRKRTASKRVNNARYDAPDVLCDDDPVQQSLGLT